MKNAGSNYTDLKNINQNQTSLNHPTHEDIELQNPLSKTKASAVFNQSKNNSEYIKANYDIPSPILNTQSSNVISLIN